MDNYKQIPVDATEINKRFNRIEYICDKIAHAEGFVRDTYSVDKVSLRYPTLYRNFCIVPKTDITLNGTLYEVFVNKVSSNNLDSILYYKVIEY